MSSVVTKRNLREQVEELLPSWQSWYPNLFDAACDLGLLRARVCDLSSLVLSKRHASVYNEAMQAFREQWLVEEPEAAHDAQHAPTTDRPRDSQLDSLLDIERDEPVE